MIKFKYRTLDCVLYKNEKKGVVFYTLNGIESKWEFRCNSLHHFMKTLGGKNGETL